jgi:hypothetical protein
MTNSQKVPKQSHFRSIPQHRKMIENRTGGTRTGPETGLAGRVKRTYRRSREAGWLDPLIPLSPTPHTVGA